jgi:ribosomal protein S6
MVILEAMKNYQLVLVLRTSLSDVARKKFLEGVKAGLKDAKFTKEEDWGEKTLSYVIKRETSGFYINFLFESKDAVVDLEKKLLAQDDVLRFLLLRIN